MDKINREPDDKESKTQLKLRMKGLQEIGTALVNLSDSQLEKIPMDDTLRDAVLHAREITDHEGKRRQLQYIGRLMRNYDPQPIEEALQKIQLKSNEGKAKFHQVERWRDKLISEGDTQLKLFIEQFPTADIQHLRQLIRKTQQEIKTNKNRGGATELFRYLREIIQGSE